MPQGLDRHGTPAGFGCCCKPRAPFAHDSGWSLHQSFSAADPSKFALHYFSVSPIHFRCHRKCTMCYTGAFGRLTGKRDARDNCSHQCLKERSDIIGLILRVVAASVFLLHYVCVSRKEDGTFPEAYKAPTPPFCRSSSRPLAALLT